MGWSSGSGLFSKLIEAAEETIADKVERKEFYSKVIEAFSDYDCDTLDECLGESDAFDEAFREIWPADDNDDWVDEGDRGFWDE